MLQEVSEGWDVVQVTTPTPRVNPTELTMRLWGPGLNKTISTPALNLIPCSDPVFEERGL